MLRRRERRIDTLNAVDDDLAETLLLQGLGVVVGPRPLTGTKLVDQRSTQFVGTDLGDGVDESARGTAELRRITGGDDLEFLDRLLRNREGRVRTLTAADTAEEGLVVIDTVDVDVRVDSALTGECDLSARGVDLGRRGQRDEILEAATTTFTVNTS